MLIATAGHVDHGKTSLVRALTGVDTDRLPEEKRRGLTIDLGFAYQTRGEGSVLGFVDVPGHERFIRNMIAGVPAIDFALLVVAADDGPMPQTREHLAILDLLGVSRGAVVVTKTDRASPARIAEVCAAIPSLLSGTTLDGAPLFALSAMTGDGVDAFREHLDAAEAALPDRSDDGGFRFAVDRSFNVRGAGLVVTGAVYAGRVKVGDRLRVAGRETDVRVRGLESAGQQVETVGAGMRCAVNLAGRGVDTHSVNRGHWLVGTAAGPLSQRMDVRLQVLASEGGPLKQWTPVHVHHGAAFVTGRVTLPGGEAIAPGDGGFAQIVTDRAISAVHGERVVLRDTTGRRTLGGAWIIDPYAPRRVRDRRARLRVLEALTCPDPADALAGAVAESVDGVDAATFAQGRGLLLADALKMAEAVGVVSVDTDSGRRLVMPAAFRGLCDALEQALAAHHEAHPQDVGPREADLLRAVARTASVTMAGAALAALLAQGGVVRDGMGLRLPTHRPALSPGDAALWERIAAHITVVSTKPPTVGDLSKSLELDRVMLLDFLERCARRGQLVRVSANRFLQPRAVLSLAQSAHALGVKCGDEGFDARAYRDATAIGRNLTIEVLEFFDVVGLTRRAGDRRRVVREPEAIFGSSQAAPRA